MSILQDHESAFSKGWVTEAGFKVLQDAEIYGASASIGAGSTCLAALWQALDQRPLSLYVPGEGLAQVSEAAELARWCERYFPDCFAEYRRRRNGS